MFSTLDYLLILQLEKNTGTATAVDHLFIKTN